MRKLVLIAVLALVIPSAGAETAPQASFNVPGAMDSTGRRVLTFVNKDPPGQRCNNNLQVAAEIANAYRLPIQLLPASLVPALPAPSVFYGSQLIVADGGEQNGLSSYQLVADVLELEGVAKQPKPGLLFNEKVRKEYDDLRGMIRSGGK
ncbi:MAG: hypothetical protein IPG66_07955 [Hydrogenophilales bacterium]|nr:hypothetical protein [Hydrogenophilales bacterium]